MAEPTPATTNARPSAHAQTSAATTAAAGGYRAEGMAKAGAGKSELLSQVAVTLRASITDERKSVVTTGLGRQPAVTATGAMGGHQPGPPGRPCARVVGRIIEVDLDRFRSRSR
eukprot:COSAG05_NODE_6227_length_995_cov_1.729911_3_plen_113_part_01